MPAAKTFPIVFPIGVALNVKKTFLCVNSLAENGQLTLLKPLHEAKKTVVVHANYQPSRWPSCKVYSAPRKLICGLFSALFRELHRWQASFIEYHVNGEPRRSPPKQGQHVQK